VIIVTVQTTVETLHVPLRK
jgi:hypothetical protein